MNANDGARAKQTVHDEMGDLHDDLEEFLAEELQDPAVLAAYEDAGARAGLLRSCIAARKDRGISQQAVAEAMATTQSAVSELENGATDPRLSTLQRYARAIGCRLDLQLCEGGPSSGWARMGVDVRYSSHEHRIKVLPARSSGIAPPWREFGHAVRNVPDPFEVRVSIAEISAMGGTR